MSPEPKCKQWCNSLYNDIWQNAAYYVLCCLCFYLINKMITSPICSWLSVRLYVYLCSSCVSVWVCSCAWLCVDCICQCLPGFLPASAYLVAWMLVKKSVFYLPITPCTFFNILVSHDLPPFLALELAPHSQLWLWQQNELNKCPETKEL